MPSQRSLSETRYYAHPQNAFWWIIANLIGFEDSINYEEKCQRLTSANIALWDVLYDCERQGSLDSNIQRDSEQVNDFPQLLDKYPMIKLIAFNGATAKQIFMRHCADLFEERKQLTWVQLPSSSPAYASIDRQQKLQLWQEALYSVISVSTNNSLH